MVLVTVLMFVLYACKKETVYTDYPYNSIEQFVLADAKGNPLKAVIRGDSILVYWPPLQDVPDTIKPTIITLADRATIAPAAGEEVAFSKETSYTVTAQDGTERTYSLHPHINQPEPRMEFSGRTFYLGADEPDRKTLFSGDFRALAISGEYIIPDTNSTKVFLIDAVSNRELPIPMKYATSLSYNAIGFIIPYDNVAGIGPGDYLVKVNTGTWKKTIGSFRLNPIHRAPFLVADYTCEQEDQDVVKGDNITIQYSISGPSAPYFRGNYTKIRLSDLYGKHLGYAEIVSQTENLLTFRLPEEESSVPVGSKIRKIDFYNSEVRSDAPNITYGLSAGSITLKKGVKVVAKK